MSWFELDGVEPTSQDVEKWRDHANNITKTMQKPMKIEIYLSSNELHSQVIQALSDAQLLHRVELNTVPDPGQPKQEQPLGLTSIRSRNCQTERMADHRLVCSACGRTIPSTPQGGVDLAQIEQEMTLGRW